MNAMAIAKLFFWNALIALAMFLFYALVAPELLSGYRSYIPLWAGTLSAGLVSFLAVRRNAGRWASICIAFVGAIFVLGLSLAAIVIVSGV